MSGGRKALAYFVAGRRMVRPGERLSAEELELVTTPGLVEGWPVEPDPDVDPDADGGGDGQGGGDAPTVDAAEVPDGSIPDVFKWIGEADDDAGRIARAAAALEVEKAKPAEGADKARSSLISDLETLVAGG